MSTPTLFIGGAWHTTTAAMVQQTFDEIFGTGVITKVDGVKRTGDARDYMLFFIYTAKPTPELEKFISQITRNGSANVIYDDDDHFWKVQLNQQKPKKGKRVMSEEEEAGRKMRR